MNRKDLLQLGILPAIIIGMIGYTSSIRLVNFLSGLMGFQFNLMHTDGLTVFALTVAGLFALCPLFAFFLFHQKFKAQSQTQPITLHLRYLVYLLLGNFIGITLNVVQIKVFRMQLEELSAEGAQWTSFVEHLNPLPYGLSFIVIVAAAIFFSQKKHQE